MYNNETVNESKTTSVYNKMFVKCQFSFSSMILSISRELQVENSNLQFSKVCYLELELNTSYPKFQMIESLEIGWALNNLSKCKVSVKWLLSKGNI